MQYLWILEEPLSLMHTPLTHLHIVRLHMHVVKVLAASTLQIISHIVMHPPNVLS